MVTIALSSYQSGPRLHAHSQDRARKSIFGSIILGKEYFPLNFLFSKVQTCCRCKLHILKDREGGYTQDTFWLTPAPF